MTTSEKDSAPKKRGPDPETLEIEGDWEDAVKKAIQKEPPKDDNENGRGK